jgi:hypothetical protein
VKEVVRIIRARSARLAEHRLFQAWLCVDGIDPVEKLAFAPAAIDFIMGFRDFNKYYVIYPDPRDDREAAINAHAREDQTHSLLFLEDWAALRIDDRLGFTPRDLYWWITCAQTQESRKLDFELMSLAFHHPEPWLRFAIVESMEAAGNVFFTRTVPVSERIIARGGGSLPYFGQYHLDRETGHLQNGDERIFFRAVLAPSERARAVRLVERVFDIFERHFALWETFARDVHEGRFQYKPAADARACTDLRPDPVEDVSRFLKLDHPADAQGDALELVGERARAFDELWQLPFYQWVREAFCGDFKRMTRYFLLQWVVDNWTCADYFAFDTTYEASSPLERGINRLSILYASEMNRRYIEWEQLELDEYTGFTPLEALRHYWLDERVEEHRAVFADLRKLTFRHPAPLYRYWIMKCFVRFGDALMHSLGVAMRNAGERNEDFIGFAGSPERMHPELPPDPEADRAIAELERRPLSREELDTIRSIIHETKEQEAHRAAISWRIVEEQRYAPFDRRFAERAQQRQS